jgi:hypothetical protein
MTEYIYSTDGHEGHWLTGEEIIRCRDCEYAHHYHPLDWRTGKPHETVEEWECTWHCNAEGASEVEPDGFCAWAKRRER